MKIEVFADISSAWCYVAKRRLEAALRLVALPAPALVSWRPCERFPWIPADGLDRRAWQLSTWGSTARAQAADALIVEAARCESLTLRLDRVSRLPNTRRAHQLIAQAERDDMRSAVVESLFHAYFHEGRDLSATATLLKIATTFGLDGDSTSAEPTAQCPGNLGVVPFVLLNGRPGPDWPWDCWGMADALRRVEGKLLLESNVIEDQRYGFARTRCGCDFCRVYCRHVPGRLDVDDLPRLCPEGADVFTWAEAHLQAVTDTSVPTLVPARLANGHCHWYADGGCNVHAKAPFGCAYFDAHMNPTEVRRRGRPANRGALENAKSHGLYYQVWQHLATLGRVRAPGARGPMEEEMNLLKMSIEQGG